MRADGRALIVARSSPTYMFGMDEVDLIQIWESVQRLITLIAPRLSAIEARQAGLERAIEEHTTAILAALAAVRRGE